MKKHALKDIGLLVMLLLLATTVRAESENRGFAALLQEGGMLFALPAGFSEQSGKHAGLQSDKWLKSDNGVLQVHYQVRPLGRIEIDYDDPHNSAPHPNDLFEMLFRTIVESLADSGMFNSKTYPVEKAQALFNAGWAAFAIFDLQPSVSTEFKYGMLLAIHRNDAADAYTLFLTNDLEAAKSQISAAMTALQFDPEAGLAQLTPVNPHQPGKHPQN